MANEQTPSHSNIDCVKRKYLYSQTLWIFLQSKYKHHTPPTAARILSGQHEYSIENIVIEAPLANCTNQHATQRR